LEVNGLVNVKHQQPCKEIGSLRSHVSCSPKNHPRHTYLTVPQRISANEPFGFKRWSCSRCMLLRERALAEFETSPALAFIFSRPIMNSDMTRDRMGKLWLKKACVGVWMRLQGVELLTTPHFRPQSSQLCSHLGADHGTTLRELLESRQLSKTGFMVDERLLGHNRTALTFLPSYPSSFEPHFWVMYRRMSYGVWLVMHFGSQVLLSCWWKAMNALMTLKEQLNSRAKQKDNRKVHL
jgi:hypothetical protein